MSKRFLIGFWSLFLGGIAAIVLLFYLLASGKLGYMPSFQELENPQSDLATEVIATDNVVLGRYYVENRSSIT